MSALLAGVLVATAPAAPLAPLDFLVNHCWAGKMPTLGQIDRHCFRRGANGSVFDHHDVTERGNKVFWGDTVYRWNAGFGAIVFLYKDSAGGTLTGLMRGRGAALDFSDCTYRTPEGGRIALATRWTRLGDTAFRVSITAEAAPQINRTTIYRRVS